MSKELEKVKDVFDYCIIDCPPDINISVINAFAALKLVQEGKEEYRKSACLYQKGIRHNQG